MESNSIRLTREFNFEMAHALEDYEGPCRNIHGHSYKLSVTVIGSPLHNNAGSEAGMVIDFKKLKQLIQAVIIDKYDHALILRKDSAIAKTMNGVGAESKILFVSFQPTCENILIEFVNSVSNKLPEHVQLHHMSLRETSETIAEWYREDNKVS